MKIIAKLLSFGLFVICASQAGEISYDLRANIFQANVYSATDTNWTNIDVYYVTNTNGWQEPNQGWGSFDRRNGSSGGIQKNSIFAHPDYEGQRSATVAEYTLTNLSSISTYYGLSDNQQYGYGNVRFVIQIKEIGNYVTILDSIVADGDYWRYFQYDLSPWVNDTIKIRLITDSNGSAAEDWAHWSESVVVMDHIPTTVYVSQSGDDSTGDGSEENPYATIQWGIEMAINGDTVIVDDGTYFENINIYNKDVAIISQNGTSNSIIDGNLNGRVFEVENSNLTLNGFSIVNGFAPNWSGGGMSIRSSNVEIVNTIFSNNQATVYEWARGGAIFYKQIDSTKTYQVNISNSIFENNCVSHDAGAIALETSAEDSSGLNITIDSCYFLNNSADHSMGAMRIKGLNTNFTITNSRFIENNAVRNAGAIDIYGKSEGIIANSLFASNIASQSDTADYNSGGVAVWSEANVEFINCTFVNNSAAYGAGLTIGGGGVASINNSIFWGNGINQIALETWESVGGMLTINYSDIEDGIDSINVDSLSDIIWGAGNFESDPLFCEPENDEYTLAENSPCLGAGTNGENIGAYNMGCGPIYYGCTDSNALNYDPNANKDDGNCEFDSWGIVHVPADYPTIQGAINVTTNGDTVLVQPGIYVENINFNGKNIIVGSLFLTTGDTSYISTTVIDGDSSGTVVTFENGEDSTTVLFGFTITNGSSTWGGGITVTYSNPTLSNLMVMGNTAEEGGGGINCGNAGPKIEYVTISKNTATDAAGLNAWRSDDVVISECLITNNSSIEGPGGIFIGRSNLTIVNSTITYNKALGGSGGGISMWQSAPVIDNVEIIENLAENNGGGVNIWSSSPTLIDCIINGNVTNGGEGGGISCGGDSLVLINSVISGNSSGTHGGAGIKAKNSYIVINNSHFVNNVGGGHGGGILLKDSTYAVVSNSVISGNSGYNGGGIHFQYNFSSSLFKNCTIVDNQTDVGGGGITIGQSSSPIFVNSIFWNDQETDVFPYNGGTVTIAYSDIQDGWEGEGNINTDPLFVDPGNGDFHLQEGSPCIDAGTPFFVWENDTLIDLNPDDYIGTAPDMGAYEYGSVSLKDYSNITPDEFSLSQNYPNPFNPVTTIRFDLPEAAEVRVVVYDILGREVMRLVNEQMEAGYQHVLWDGKDYNGKQVPTGIYIARMEAGEYSKSIKMLLMK